MTRYPPLLLAMLALSTLPLHAASSYTERTYETRLYPPRSDQMIFTAPDRPDFMFDEGETLTIECYPQPRALTLKWKLCRNMIGKPLRRGMVELAVNNRFPIRIATEGLLPGFYDVHVEVKLTDRQRIKGVATFGWQAEQQRRMVLRPDDFDEFWQQARAKLDEVPLEIEREAYATFERRDIDQYNRQNASLPEHPDPGGEVFQTVEVFKIRFKSVGATIHAWYAKPPGKGPFPGLLVVPGAGNAPRPIPMEAARHGFAAMDINVHGDPVDWPRTRYSRITREDPTTPEGLLYYKISLHALQAVNALQAQEEVDQERIFAEGGSQGGFLTTVVCAQDKRLKGGVALIPFKAYLPYRDWVNKINRAKADGADGISLEALGTLTPSMLSHRYVDAQNHAARIECPIMFIAGLIDNVSYATTVYALHQQAPQSTFVPMPNIGHDTTFVSDKAAWRWLQQRAGIARKEDK